MKNHELKITPRFFQDLLARDKNFELRRNDRDFHVGDLLTLREYEPDTKAYSGWTIIAKISYLLEGYTGLEAGYCILALELIILEHEPVGTVQP